MGHILDIKYNNTIKLEGCYRALLRGNHSDDEPQIVCKAVEKALGPLPYVNWPFNNSYGVTRARMINEEHEDVTKLSTFGPPPKECASKGRANIQGHPVFYGTFDGRTAMQEIKVPVGSKCFVSVWEFEKTIPTVSAFLQHAEMQNDFAKIDISRRKAFPPQLRGVYSKSSFYKAMLLRSLLFTGKNEDISAKISHNIIYGSSAKSDGVLYPSVIDPFRCNIALHPDFVTKNMKCVMILKQIWSGAFIFRTLARGYLQGNEIEWKNTGDWEDDDVFRKYSGGNGPNEIHPNALKVLNKKAT